MMDDDVLISASTNTKFRFNRCVRPHLFREMVGDEYEVALRAARDRYRLTIH
ncbi:MAG: hypothetical protein AAFV53_05795 [Myxococcota bacterium]